MNNEKEKKETFGFPEYLSQTQKDVETLWKSFSFEQKMFVIKISMISSHQQKNPAEAFLYDAALLWMVQNGPSVDQIEKHLSSLKP